MIEVEAVCVNGSGDAGGQLVQDVASGDVCVLARPDVRRHLLQHGALVGVNAELPLGQ